MRQKLLLIISLLLAVTGCGTANHDNEAKAPKSQSELKGKNYQDVVTLFESAGFNNIETEKIEDLIMGWLTKDGEVESISIGGDTEYSTSKWYPKDTKVRISYHTFPEKERKEASSNVQENNKSSSTQFGDYLIDLPESWIKAESNYYVETGEGVTMLSYSVPDIEVSSFEILDNAKTDYLDGVKKPLENVRNDSLDTIVVNDNKVIVNTFDAEINGRNVKMEVDLLHCPESKRLLALFFAQSLKSSTDHFEEYHNVLSTIRLKSEDDKKASATPKPTKSPSSTKTPSSFKKDITEEIITAENNADFADLLSMTYLDPEKQQAFVSKYKGRIIEFDCVVAVLDMDPNGSKWVASYVFCPGEDFEHMTSAMFVLENVTFHAFHWDDATRPSNLYQGSKIRLQARVKTGSDEMFIYIEPTKTWGRD